MNTLQVTLAAAALTLSVAGAAWAQPYEVGIRLLISDPTGEFAESLDNPGVGIAAHFGARPIPSLTFGFGLDAMIYGSETRTYRLPLVEDFDLTTTNNMAGGYLFAQFRPIQGIVEPYGEFRVGLNYLWTESKLEDEDWFDDDEVARKTNYDDFATHWGGGGGILIRVKSGNHAESSPGVYLDFKVTHLEGSEAEYLTEGDVTIENDVPVFRPSRSETDMTSYRAGVVLTF